MKRIILCSRYVSIADEEEWHISQSKDAWGYTSWSCVVVLAYEIEYMKFRKAI
jgi:hypothetical protein